MKNPVAFSWLFFFIVLLVGAAPALSVEECMRKGNEAFRNKQFQEALEWYQKAAERSTDPGLPAYNQALAHYHLGNFRDAELQFRRCLEDAENVRRAQALYGLGNSLMMQAGTTDAALLKNAIICFQLCRKEKAVPSDLLPGVNHNLELARLLLVQALANAKDPPPPGGADTPPKKPNGTDPGEKPGGPSKFDPNETDPKNGKPETSIDPNLANQAKNKTPVAGHPPIPDDEKLVPIPAEDLAHQLQKHTERILQEALRSQNPHTGPLPGVKDW